ncbi:MAG: ATP-binding cassette domain-containing protein [Deltaproteobacteria bacterium]|nr:ATP-binding cassette domain-containing protein [Deltaproteobacteria bacterium]
MTPNKFIIQQLSLKLPNGATILHDISLEIPAGRITAVIGPSGSGKSSLLRCLNRLWEPPPGSIFIDGGDITAMDVLLLRRRVGMLFQAPALFEGTVADNIAYGHRIPPLADTYPGSPGPGGRGCSDLHVSEGGSG